MPYFDSFHSRRTGPSAKTSTKEDAATSDPSSKINEVGIEGVRRIRGGAGGVGSPNNRRKVHLGVQQYLELLKHVEPT